MHEVAPGKAQARRAPPGPGRAPGCWSSARRST